MALVCAGASFNPDKAPPPPPVAPLVWPLSAQELALTQTKLPPSGRPSGVAPVGAGASFNPDKAPPSTASPSGVAPGGAGASFNPDKSPPLR